MPNSFALTRWLGVFVMVTCCAFAQTTLPSERIALTDFPKYDLWGSFVVSPDSIVKLLQARYEARGQVLDVETARRIPLDISVVLPSGAVGIDLSGLTVRTLFVTAGNPERDFFTPEFTGFVSIIMPGRGKTSGTVASYPNFIVSLYLPDSRYIRPIHPPTPPDETGFIVYTGDVFKDEKGLEGEVALTLIVPGGTFYAIPLHSLEFYEEKCEGE